MVYLVCTCWDEHGNLGLLDLAKMLHQELMIFIFLKYFPGASANSTNIELTDVSDTIYKLMKKASWVEERWLLWIGVNVDKAVKNTFPTAVLLSSFRVVMSPANLNTPYFSLYMKTRQNKNKSWSLPMNNLRANLQTDPSSQKCCCPTPCNFYLFIYFNIWWDDPF